MNGRRASTQADKTSGQSRAAVISPSAAEGARDLHIQDIRRDLERQRQTLLDEAGVGFIQEAKTPTFPDVSDQATAEAEQNFALRIRERERNLIKKIDEALNRMVNRLYGICESCGEEIPIPRLKARPVTTLCIACKTQQEEKENGRQ